MLKTGEMMNGVRYRQLLEEKLQLFMDRQGCTHFLQDGAPCHWSKIVTAWFQQRIDIQLVDWPGNWTKKKLEDHNSTILQQWKEDILKVWVESTEECAFLQNLVTSMPCRMQDVINREGAMTKY
jgi:hypothetical protein